MNLWSIDIMVLVGATFLLAGIVKGVLGMGLPVVAMALLAATLGLKTAIVLTLIPALVTNGWQALVGGGFVELSRRLWPMLVMAVIGIWFGVSVLAASSSDALLVMLALVLIAYAGWSLTRPQIAPPGRLEPFLSPIVGGSSGILYGMVGIYMVPGVLYLQALGLPRDRLVQALGMSFFVISVALLAAMQQHAILDHDAVALSVAALVPVSIGMIVGRRLRGLFSETQYRTAFFVGLIVAGVYILARALLT